MSKTFKFNVRPKRNPDARPFEISTGPHESPEDARAHVEKFSPNLVIVDAVVDKPAADAAAKPVVPVQQPVVK